MPSRTLRESYTSSDKVAAMEPGPQDRLPRYFLAADDFGCLRIQPEVIKGRIYARRPDVTPEIVAADLLEFERVGCLLTWTAGDKTFGWFTGWWEHNRQPRPKTIRKTPTPPVLESLSEQEQGGKGEPNPFDRKYTAAVPQQPAAEKRPQFAVRSSQFVHAQEPPIAPVPGAALVRLVPPVKLPKRNRHGRTLQDEREIAVQQRRDLLSRALDEWVVAESKPVWDEPAGREIERAPPDRDARIAWVQEKYAATREEAEDATAIVAGEVEGIYPGARNG